MGTPKALPSFVVLLRRSLRQLGIGTDLRVTFPSRIVWGPGLSHLQSQHRDVPLPFMGYARPGGALEAATRCVVAGAK